MRLSELPRIDRRAILIYIGTIALPACVLLGLGIHSFQLQRANLATLTAEKLEAEINAESLAAAKIVLAGGIHPIAKYLFTIDHGVVVHPALHSPLPQPVPTEFLEADRQELIENRFDLALESYRKLFVSRQNESLALAGIARCLQEMGRADESRNEWRRLATSFPEDRDASYRPYGITAAIAAGDTAGLYEKIASGRWDLDAEQAEHFLKQLDPGRALPPYMDQFTFARDLDGQFRRQGEMRENEVQSYNFGKHQVFYHTDGAGRISGFAVNANWIDHTLRPRIEEKLGIKEAARRDLFVYGGAGVLVCGILSAGVLLLLGHMSREARTNRLRSEFVSSVSHELKTPITLVRLYSETLLRHAGLREAERTDFYRIIMRESERLGRLVNQILAFSRVERGDQTYKFEEGDLAPALSGIVEDYREFLERSGFSVKRVLPDSTPLVRFDPAALSQAVINLLDNAVKYSGESRDIAVRLDVRDGDVAFEVEDHGVGIAVSEQQKIFDRFYRVQNGSGKGGYGLGLFMVRHIMDAHGGRAEVESEPGRGSRFRLIFPVVNEWANNASS
jgi:signal transduction histidine kinase